MRPGGLVVRPGGRGWRLVRLVVAQEGLCGLVAW